MTIELTTILSVCLGVAWSDICMAHDRAAVRNALRAAPKQPVVVPEPQVAPRDRAAREAERAVRDEYLRGE